MEDMGIIDWVIILVVIWVVILVIIAIFRTSSKVSKIQTSLEGLKSSYEFEINHLYEEMEKEKEKAKKLWDDQHILLNTQKFLLDEQNLMLIRMLNKIETISNKI